MAMTFTVAAAQMAPSKAKIDENLDTIAAMSIQSAESGVDLVVFPETAVSGYFVEGGVLECSMSASELAARLSPRLATLAKPLDLIVGFYENQDGSLHNSAAYLAWSSGQLTVVGTYRKFFLPTYGVFDEERFVNRGRALGVFDTRFGKVGILICEDVWHSILPTLSALSGTQLLVVPSASPARNFEDGKIGNLCRYDRMLRSVAEEHGIFVLNCQLCGFEGGKGFSGGSSLVDPFGHVIVSSPIFEPHLLVGPVDLDLVSIARSQLPLLSDLQSAWGDVKRIVGEIE